MKFGVLLIAIGLGINGFCKEIPFIVYHNNQIHSNSVDITDINFDNNLDISKAIINNAEKIEVSYQTGNIFCKSYDDCFLHMIVNITAKGYTIKSAVIHMKPYDKTTDTSMKHVNEFVINNRKDIMTDIFSNIIENSDQYIAKND